jgi:hypothetical protein
MMKNNIPTNVPIRKRAPLVKSPLYTCPRPVKISDNIAAMPGLFWPFT